MKTRVIVILAFVLLGCSSGTKSSRPGTTDTLSGTHTVTDTPTATSTMTITDTPTATNTNTVTNTATATGICSTPATSNNSAILSGATLGSRTMGNSTLMKTVPVSITGTQYAASVGYVMRSSSTSSYTDFVIPITNTGSSTRCFVSVSSGNAGAYDMSGDFLTGSVGYSGTVYTNTCLAPCETGYLIDITNTASYAVIGSIALALTDTSGMALSSARVIPQSYGYDSINGLAVLVRNTGSLTVDIASGYHQYIFLDENNQAVEWGFLDASSAPYLSASSTVSMDDTSAYLFLGTASKLVALVDFAGVGTTGALSLQPSPEDQARLDAVSAQRMRQREVVFNGRP